MLRENRSLQRKGASLCVSRHVIRAEHRISIDQGAAQRPKSEARATEATAVARASSASPASFPGRPDAEGDVRAPPNFARVGGKDRRIGRRGRRGRRRTGTAGVRVPFSTRNRRVRGSPSAAAYPDGPAGRGTSTPAPSEASMYRPSVSEGAFRPPHPASARRTVEADAVTVRVA
jgi:hypothetical protein